MFWIIAGIVAMIALIICIILGAVGVGNEIAEFIASFITGIFALCVLVSAICCRCEYREFEKSFEIQRNIVEQIAESDPGELARYTYIADAVDANGDLAHWQGKYKTYGPMFTFVPERVMDIKPIFVN